MNPQTNESREDSTPLNVSCSCCQEVGMTIEGVRITQLSDGTWEAKAKIGSIFGSEVEGEIVGKGKTKDEALAALAKDRHELHESLWA